MRVRVPAPTPATCWQHCVSVGQQVSAGSDIISLECMKMEFPVQAPVSGTIVWLIPMGDLVEKDGDVAVIETG